MDCPCCLAASMWMSFFATSTALEMNEGSHGPVDIAFSAQFCLLVHNVRPVRFARWQPHLYPMVANASGSSRQSVVATQMQWKYRLLVMGMSITVCHIKIPPIKNSLPKIWTPNKCFAWNLWTLEKSILRCVCSLQPLAGRTEVVH